MPIRLSPILLYFIFVYKAIASITVVDVGVLPLVENSVGITFFVDITNEDRQNICKLYSYCKKCCLIDSNKVDCDITVAFGEDIQTVKPKDRKTLLYVIPVLLQHDLIGYCDFLLIYDSNNTKEEIDVTIPFDTQVDVKKSQKLMNQYVGARKIRHCSSLDDDSLNNCKPVDCNVKYLDKRPIFDHTLNKCVKAPLCFTNPDKELPDYVYIPNSNICRNLDLPLTVQDIYAISTGLGTVTMPHDTTFEMQVQVKSNCSTISQNLNLLRDLMNGKMYPSDDEIIVDYSECIKSSLLTVGVCVISVCTILFIVVCCVNCTVWFYIQWSDGNLNKLWKFYKNPFKRRKSKNNNIDKINSTIKNALLREVIAKDIPLELRNSVVDVCDRIGREVERKKRYREAEVGSQISLKKCKECPSTSISSAVSEENDKYM